jgi:spermidine synthase
VGAVLASAGPWVFLSMTDGLAYLPREASATSDALRLGTLTAMVVGPAMVALGVAFPATFGWGARGDDRVAARVGARLGWNVAGCVAGALLAGFVLPGTVGLWRGMLAIAVLVALGSAVVAARDGLSRAHAWVALAATGLALIAATLDWPRVHLAKEERILALAEGPDGIVAVVERPGSRRLKLNNHYVLGGTAATGDERMQGHLPLLLHPQPRSVAFLGLGTAITASAALFHGVERIVGVELVPEVTAAARAHFQGANERVLDAPRATVVAADARAWLRTTPERFDVIVGDLVVPWRPGESALYTREHFAAAREALAPGGLFCQWVPAFQLGEDDVDLVVRTLLSVFPSAQVWRGDFSAEDPAFALVAAREPIALDPAVVARALAYMRPDPANAHLADPAGAWLYFTGVIEKADLPAGRIHDETHPWLELAAARADGDRLTGRRLQRWLGRVRERSEGRIAALGAS